MNLLHNKPAQFGLLPFGAAVAQSQVDQQLIAAPGPGKRIKVVQLFIVCGDTGTAVTFESGGVSAIPNMPALDFGNNGGMVLPYNEAGWFVCNPNESLTVTTGAGSTTAIGGLYVVVDE